MRTRRDQRQYHDAISAGIYAGGATDPSAMPFVSPWASNDNLRRWAFNDAFGHLPQNTRQAAMSIPALARARNLVCTQIAKSPLVEMDGVTPYAPPPGWLTAAPGGQSPQHRMVWTVDDLIFYGLSCWLRDDQGNPGMRLNQDDWEINSDRREILVNGESKAPDEVVLFTGFHEGILGFGQATIADILDLYGAVRARIKNPVPMVELHQTGGLDLTEPQRDSMLDGWRTARQDPDGAVGYTSKDIELKTHGADADAQLMIEGRNAASVDAARLIGVHAGNVDATTPKASLNYETTSGRNQELVDFDLDLYMTPIAARLSLDDICAPGRHIAFDLSSLTSLAPAPTGPALED